MSIDMDKLADGLCSLFDTSDNRLLLEDVIRRLRLIRRAGHAILEAEESEGESRLALAIVQCFTHLVDLAEDVLTLAKVVSTAISTRIVAIPADQQDLTTSAPGFSTLACDALLNLSVLPGSTNAAARNYLTRGVDLLDSNAAMIPLEDRIKALGEFATAANMHSMKVLKANDAKEAAVSGRLACDWTRKAVDLVREADSAEGPSSPERWKLPSRPEWFDLEERLQQRLFALNAMYLRDDDHLVSGVWQEAHQPVL